MERRLLLPAPVLRRLTASAAIASLFTGCVSGPAWPEHPVALSARSFAARGDVATIDVLPLDLELWAEPDYEVDLDGVHTAAEASVMNLALDTLAARNYRVASAIDWNGDVAGQPGQSVLGKDELLATVSSLARYGAAAIARPGELPVPYLPAPLGMVTGADATLYIGGWGYVTRRRESTGEQVAEAVLITLLIVGVVVIIIAALAGKGGHGGSSGGHGGGSSGGHGGGSSGGAHGAGSSGGHGLTGGNGAGGVHHIVSSGRGAAISAPRVSPSIADAFSRTIFSLAVQWPELDGLDWRDDPSLPHDGSEPQLYLEMTLIDNRTGLALWHAHQLFPADATSTADTERAARTLLEALPAAAAPKAAAK